MAAACHVETGAWLRERSEAGRDDHRRGVADQNSCRWHGHTHALQHIRKALRREDRLAFVPGSVQSYNDSISNKLVVTHSFDRDQFLQARCSVDAPEADG
jgi:hypothetical protein